MKFAAPTPLFCERDFEAMFPKKGKKMVGIERFDEERSDEEPCGMTARQLLHKISQPNRAKRAWEARKQKSGAAANEICSADTAVLRERF